MLHSGKCPHCLKTVSSVRAENIEVRSGVQLLYNAVSYLCPYCQHVLSVSYDPTSDVVKRTLRALRKG